MKNFWRPGLAESKVSLEFTTVDCILVIFYLACVWPVIVNMLANLQSRVRKGTMTPEKFERTISLLKGVLDYESFKDVDMVIEVSPTSYFTHKK